jgi:beta-N-acetylhexosaminidase
VAIFADDLRTSEGGRAFDRAIRARVPDALVLYLDEANAGPLTPQVLTAVEQAERVVAVTDVIPSAGRRAGSASGSVALAPNSGDLLSKIVQKAGDKTVVVALGNPYVIAGVPKIQTYLCTFSNVPVSAASAVRALFAEIPIHGKMPVTIPGVAQRGTGLELNLTR